MEVKKQTQRASKDGSDSIFDKSIEEIKIPNIDEEEKDEEILGESPDLKYNTLMMTSEGATTDSPIREEAPPLTVEEELTEDRQTPDRQAEITFQ